MAAYNQTHLTFLFSIFLTALAGSAWSASGWEAEIPRKFSDPSPIIVVDKGQQNLTLVQQAADTTPASFQLVCATGSNAGDKKVEGDLRTPEGVYFLEKKMQIELDFSLYGDTAFALNFPNPVDRIRGKTGHGIWLHGRGHRIKPMETKGCIALNNPDIKDISPLINPGFTPTIIAQKVKFTKSDKNKLEAALRKQVKAWAKAWSAKSDSYFNFYDFSRYSIAHKTSQKDFVEHKKNLFSRYKSIEIQLGPIACLQGPGYAVTYFPQLFSAPGFTSQGIKRLYWQKDSRGKWKIVGSEFQRADLGLKPVKPEKPINELDLMEWLAEWQQAWLTGNPEQYISFYDQNAVQDHRKGQKWIFEHKKKIWQGDKLPMQVKLGQVRLLSTDPPVFSFVQDYRSKGGYTDRGIKKLTLAPGGANRWKITSETWKAIDEQ